MRKHQGTETNLKRQVMRMLAHDYPMAVVRKRHGSIYSTKGDPDLEILFRGIHIECELKQVGQSPTPLQATRLAEWAQAGAVAACIHTVEEMRTLMRNVASLRNLGPELPFEVRLKRV
jgi:hypothetical protein